MQQSNTDKIINITCKETGVSVNNGLLISIDEESITSYHVGSYIYELIGIICGPGAYKTAKEYEESGDTDNRFNFDITTESGLIQCVTTDMSLFTFISNRTSRQVQGGLYNTLPLDEYFAVADMLLANAFDECCRKNNFKNFTNMLYDIVKRYIDDNELSPVEKVTAFMQFNFLRYEREFGCEIFPRTFTDSNGQEVTVSFNEEQINKYRESCREDGYAFDENDTQSKCENIDKYLEEDKEEHHLAKNLKPNLFFSGICAYRCDTEEKYETLRSFLKWTKYLSVLEQLERDKKKALSTGCVYYKNRKLNYAFDISRTGCDSYIDLEGVLPKINN